MKVIYTGSNHPLLKKGEVIFVDQHSTNPDRYAVFANEDLTGWYINIPKENTTTLPTGYTPSGKPTIQKGLVIDETV